MVFFRFNLYGAGLNLCARLPYSAAILQPHSSFQSIGSVNRRLCDFEDDRNAISDDMKVNERNGEFLLMIIEKHDPSLANKVSVSVSRVNV